MRKVKIVLFLILSLAIIFNTSCVEDIPNVITDTPSILSEITPRKGSDVLAEGKNYKVETSASGGETKYHCFVLNNDGKVLSDEIIGEYPVFTYLSNDVLQEKTGYGGAIDISIHAKA